MGAMEERLEELVQAADALDAEVLHIKGTLFYVQGRGWPMCTIVVDMEDGIAYLCGYAPPVKDVTPLAATDFGPEWALSFLVQAREARDLADPITQALLRRARLGQEPL